MTDLAIQKQENADVLDRQWFVDRLCMIVDAAAVKRHSLCFAVNGGWGVGKSFVLSMFEQQASQFRQPDSQLPRYLILRYNCWEYDYYAEPLVAIVAAMLEEVERKVDDAQSEKRSRLIATLKAIGMRLLKGAAQAATNATGIPFDDIMDIAVKGADADKKQEKQSHAFDDQYRFKKILKEFRALIAALAQEQTVIFLVDELDRCMPEYTIRVLERIHHLFDGIENVQVIFSIDKAQLNHVVRQIYGGATDADKYLRKFITFELRLEPGTVRERFDERFRSYAERFALVWDETDGEETATFRSMILEGLDMRTRVALIEKCELLHEMLVPQGRSDESIACLELFLAVLHLCEVDLQWAKQHFALSEVFAPENLWKDVKTQSVPTGLQKFGEYCSSHPKLCTRLKSMPETLVARSTVYTDTVYGMVLAAYRRLLGWKDDNWTSGSGENMRAFIYHAVRMWGLLEVID